MRLKLIGAGVALLSSTAVQAEWHQATSKHFVVYSDDSAGRVQAFAEQLERFDKAIRVWHVAPNDVRGPSARVTVFVVKDTGEIEKLIGRSGVAGFYSPRAGQSVAFTPRSSGQAGDAGLSSRAVLFHEYAHHWMLTNWADAALPPWFVEGFAELHATALFRDNSVIFGANPSYRRYTVGRMNLLPSDRLLRPDPGRLSPEETDALYSRGWALTHYLTFDPERRKQLANYIGALNSGKAADANNLIGDRSSLDLKLNGYVKRRSLPSAAFSFDQLPIGEVKVRPLTAPEAAMMPAFILSKRGVDKTQAPKVAALARRLAAPYPNDLAAQGELAEAEFDLCESDEKSDAACYARAEAAVDRALAVDPRSVHALTYKGMTQVAAAKKAKEADPKKWAAARQWFLAANKIDTEAPQPLIQFYDSFAAAEKAPSKNAQGGLLYAYALAPYDGDLRLKAAQVLLNQDKMPQARVALAPVAYSVEDRAKSERAKKVMAALDGGDKATALAELSKEPDKDEKDS